MSAEAIAAMAPEQAQIEVASELPNDSLKPTGLHSPPDSNSAMKLDDSDDSELSDLDDPEPSIDVLSLPTSASAQEGEEVKKEDEEEEDIGEVLPDHWSGTVPVFKPDMRQFKDFKKFMEKIDSYGMKCGIVKVIPPTEWKEKLPELHDLVKQVRVKEPIKQEIMGSNGTYRQVNILHQRSYNLPQWRQLCDQSEHQPPARRGERRAHVEKPKVAPKPKAVASSSKATAPKGRGRNTRSKVKKGTVGETSAEQDRPMTPISPKSADEIIESVENDPGAEVEEDDEDSTPVVGRMGAVRQPKPKTQSTSARRKYAKREASAKIDEEAFRDWDYKMDISDYTPERCEELERIYWKTLTYAPPLYGADLPGTLFSDETDTWNLNKLPNLLDVLGTKVPGVNTAYLYLGMWKATFAWHLEDVDLYSINYLHFGAPKQWYSISQGDARRFESVMKSIWPTDAKHCDQFLRHKAFLISPAHLQQYFNIKVNKCISYPGEFVVTYPYGYHSGYNLGYNCAEAVNFALDSWLPMGKIAKRCECAQAQDSVWMDVYEIERKLRGEETEYEETEDEEEEEEDDDDDTGLRSSQLVKIKQPTRKRKRTVNDKDERKAKKIRLRVRIKAQAEPPCCLCPNSVLDAELLPTDDGRKAHRLCALYGPETWIETVDGKEVVANAANISKARLELKCLYCRSKRGACFQCSRKKCARSYHATCAAAAGVFVEEGEVPIFGEDGTEYKEQAFEFSCRFHRTKRDKKLDSIALDDCKKTREAATALKKGDIAQLQYYRGEIFAGVVVENRHDEQTFLIEIIPNGCEANMTYNRIGPPMLTWTSDRFEVEWKWLLLPDPADYHLPKASANAIPMPTSRKAKDEINATKRTTEELPRAEAPFVDGFTWAEFHNIERLTNKEQVNVDLSKENQIWHYLGRTSTEARAQYTEDPRSNVHNSKSNFLDTVPRPAPPATSQPRKSYTPAYPMSAPTYGTPAKHNRPYQYKPKNPIPPAYTPSSSSPQQFTTQQFVPNYLAGQPFSTTLSTFAPRSSTGPPRVPPPTQTHQTTTRLPHSMPRSMSQTGPRPTHITNPTPPHPAHSRNKSMPFGSSAHIRNKSLPFGSDKRYRSSSTYASARFDSSSSSPFSYGIMQPPGLGTSPSPQNGQLFQAQARERSNSAASSKSFTMPMTSSAIRPSSSASSQDMGGQPQVVKLPIPKPPQPSVLQKYAFFQVHHNRDSTKYRTPYAPWGGFTNGFEGNLRAHLMKTPDALFSAKNQQTALSGGSSMSPIPQYPATNSLGATNSAHPPLSAMYDKPGQHTTSTVSPYSPGSQGLQPGQSYSTSVAPGSTSLQTASGPFDPSSVLTKLHPAIRAQYAAMLQRTNYHLQAQMPPQSKGLSPAQQSHPSQAYQAPHFVGQSQAQRSQQRPGQLMSEGRQANQAPQSQYTYTQLPNVSQQAALQLQAQASSSPHQLQVYSSNQNDCKTAPGPHKTAVQNVQTNSDTVQSPQTTSAQASQIYQPTPKQTFVPPPRPWEQLQRVGQANSVPLGVGGGSMEKGNGPSQPIPEGLQPSNSQSAAPLQPVPVPLSSPTKQSTHSAPALASGTTSVFPEVPAGSMELVEEIIRNARRASGFEFGKGT